MSSVSIQVQGTSLKISSTTVAALSDSPSPAFEVLDCIGREFNYQSGATTENEVTTICSTAKEFKLGLSDSGSFSLSGHWKIGNDAHDAIKAAYDDKQPRLIEVEFVDNTVFRCLGLCTQRSFSGAVDGIVSASYQFRLTGPTEEA